MYNFFIVFCVFVLFNVAMLYIMLWCRVNSKLCQPTRNNYWLMRKWKVEKQKEKMHRETLWMNGLCKRSGYKEKMGGGEVRYTVLKVSVINWNPFQFNNFINEITEKEWEIILWQLYYLLITTASTFNEILVFWEWQFQSPFRVFKYDSWQYGTLSKKCCQKQTYVQM